MQAFCGYSPTMTAPGPSKIDQIRSRDGDCCWLCGGKLDFNAPPNTKKAPTKEHLTPKSLGGTDRLDNLVLCHPGCNKQLGNRPAEEKRKMQAKRQAQRAKQMSAIKPPTLAQPTPKYVPHSSRIAADWRRIALAAIGMNLFLGGMITGMLIA